MSVASAPSELERYVWPPSSAQLAAAAGLDPTQIIRFDGNVPALAPVSARPATVARALAQINEYERGGYPALRAAIAARHGVGDDQVVLAPGSDALILLAARTFAAAGTVATVPARTYPYYRIAAAVAGARLIDDPARAELCFVCRPNNPTGELTALPARWRLAVVDEAYADYSGETVIDRVDQSLIVLRTFSKAFALAGARVAYAIAVPALAAALRARQTPLPIAAPSAALALAALATEPAVGAQIEERERLADGLRALALAPLESHTNFLFVPVADPDALRDGLLRRGIVVRRFDAGIRISVRDPSDDDRLLDALAAVLGGEPPARRATGLGATVRYLRATAETRMQVRLRLRGGGRVRVAAGAGLYDHLLEQLAFHGGLDLDVDGSGDLETGPHHTVEDLFRAFGDALDRGLGDRRGVSRYGSAEVPMDEACAHAVIDLSGRPVARIEIAPDPGLAVHAFESLVQSARVTLHLSATGRDAHHTAEAAAKATGRALRQALASVDARADADADADADAHAHADADAIVMSTKGML